MLKWLKRIALLLLIFAALAFATGWWLLRGSLPQLDGELALPGLSAPVGIQRDALGVVTIDATNETDMARALGYVHAQERYFEMDLMRRTAAGELAELFGPVAIDADKRHRVHRIRARVTQHLGQFAGEHMPQLQAYTDGVNAGLDNLRVRPWPYLVLRQTPRRWEVVDSALAGYAMYFDLQDSQNARELASWKMKSTLPPALFALLAHDGSEWDAPMFGGARGNAVLPDAAQVDLRKLPSPDTDVTGSVDRDVPGSNNWAVSGALTRDGRAIVADDMHLGLRAPNIWFRARLRYTDPLAPNARVDVSGFTLPGLPAVIVGSNGHVAWGFTNGYGDWADWVRIDPCPEKMPATATAPACTNLSEYRETISVAGADPQVLSVRESVWGPVMHEQADGSLLALRWVAHLPGALKVSWADMARASDLDAAFAIADRAAIPAQNLVLADSSGRIGWRVLATIPQRGSGCNAIEPGSSTGELTATQSGADASDKPPVCAPWNASASAAPRVVDPPSGRLWSANNRVLDDAGLSLVGDGGYALGARARQIRDALFAKEKFDEASLLQIQLDDRALFLQRWWRLLQREGAGDTPALGALAQAATRWDGRASTASASYRIVRAWRLAVHQRIGDGLTAPARAAAGEDFLAPDLPQLEGVVWPLLEQRPPHLLPRRFENWTALLEDAAVEVRDELSAHGPLEQRGWGERNTAKICHPLAQALPVFAQRLLCMPAEALAGDTAMPRVQGASFGASQRMVVSPGHEADGIAHMPGGQSGNPLSPFWGAGHDAWVQGRPTPFLPGKTAYTLILRAR